MLEIFHFIYSESIHMRVSLFTLNYKHEWSFFDNIPIFWDIQYLYRNDVPDFQCNTSLDEFGTKTASMKTQTMPLCLGLPLHCHTPDQSPAFLCNELSCLNVRPVSILARLYLISHNASWRGHWWPWMATKGLCLLTTRSTADKFFSGRKCLRWRVELQFRG